MNLLEIKSRQHLESSTKMKRIRANN